MNATRFDHLAGEGDDELAPEAFPVLTIGEMAALVDAAPPPRYLVRGLIVEGDYGVLGAEKKFGKTWAMADLSVNVAGGGAFLGRFPVERSGPVLLFAGEGGQRKIVRRMRAVAAFYGINMDTLPLYVHERAPKLADLAQVVRLEATVRQVRPVLVIIDPSYLALAGAETSNLAQMGELLERAQFVAQANGAALIMSHHWNKTGQGSGADRFTGVGFAEWGRVLISGSSKSKQVTDEHTGMTTRIVKLEITGDEVADTEVMFRRRVWEERRDDLTSPMFYEIEIVEDDGADELSAEPEIAGLRPAGRRVLAVLRAHPDVWLDHVRIGDELAQTGIPLKARTIQLAGQQLVEAGLARESGGSGAVRKTYTAVLVRTSTPKEDENAL